MAHKPRPYDRLTRINSLLQNVLSRHIPIVLHLPADKIITITRVITSRDLGHAKIFVTCFPDDAENALMKQVQLAVPAIRHAITPELTFHHVPALSFHIDHTEKKAQHIERLLDSLKT